MKRSSDSEEQAIGILKNIRRAFGCRTMPQVGHGAVLRRIVVRYHSSRMLLTLDVYKLFEILVEVFGECSITFEPMSDSEKNESVENVDGIELIRRRFMVLELLPEKKFVRHENVENRCLHEGMKVDVRAEGN